MVVLCVLCLLCVFCEIVKECNIIFFLATVRGTQSPSHKKISNYNKGRRREDDTHEILVISMAHPVKRCQREKLQYLYLSLRIEMTRATKCYKTAAQPFAVTLSFSWQRFVALLYFLSLLNLIALLKPLYMNYLCIILSQTLISCNSEISNVDYI